MINHETKGDAPAQGAIDGYSTVPATTVYVAGSGHSGSTLLDLMLGGHPGISALGEAHLLYLATRMTGTPFLCVCGEHVLKCPFWARTEQELARLIGDGTPGLLERFITTDPGHIDRVTDDHPLWLMHPRLEPLSRLNPDLDRMAMVVGSPTLWSALERVSDRVRVQRVAIRNSVLLYDAVRRAHGTPVVVDSTKNPARLKGLYMETPCRFRVLHLIRDGRAVAASRVLRDDISMAACAKAWRIQQLKLSSVMWNVPASIVKRVRYEDLCRNPEGELIAICNWVGLDFDARMLEIRSADRHGVGGNPMRFQRAKRGIRLDDRWRTEISPADLATFERIAGRINRRRGYT
jgi:hypothetical protein